MTGNNVSTFHHYQIPPPQCYLNQGDAVTWLESMPNESANLVLFDPAYESLEKHREKGTTTRLSKSKSSSNEWFQIFKNGRFPELFLQMYRVLARNSHCYMLCDQETMFVTVPMAEAAGFKFWKPIIWDKVSMGMGYHYRARYEVVLFFEKGKRKLANLGIPDVLSFPRVRNGYPTEKPVDLLRTLVYQSSLPGEWVIDPFMGSGSAGEASLGLGRNFSGNDLSPKSLELAGPRCASAIANPRPWVDGKWKDIAPAVELEDKAAE